MTRVAMNRTAFPDTGLNLTDATYTTLVAGANNGVEVPLRDPDIIVLKNGTGGAAVFTFKVPQPDEYSEHSITVPDKTYSVAAAKTWLIPASLIYRQSDGDVYIDCDVAGQVLVLIQ